MTHPIDKHVGQAVRLARQISGLSQSELGAAIGVRFQQVQKYETGANRISSSKLWDIANTLGAPVSDFFPDSTKPLNGAKALGLSRQDARLVSSILQLSARQKSAFLEIVTSLESLPKS
ncbi:helix-turn-helix transcriptional regulator [Aliiroseovarius subalbicans]|uniref:helix-turn-helix domain-containing protein n=1 Tax=Aliiroseovarius subalbicans TaxID=2925840 RepID=UPI001F5932BF|nr:helix-turn-helix transcriptional regulator [Aliiroseovarius subalbicans]MCI2399295.1 helix-turn-helix domain-containing protein [Aliiroseovarius subalbicans]